MPDIRFITGGELETASHHIWTATGSGVAPASGISGAHGKSYDLSAALNHGISFDATPIATAKTRFLFQTSVDNEPIMQLNDGISAQLSIIYRDTGAIEVKRSSTVLAASATGLFLVDTQYEVEFRARISNGGGSIAVNRNGSQIICIPSGLNTQATGNAQTNRWIVVGSTLNAVFDDCVLDRSGEYLGTGEVETLMPNGAGDVTELTPSNILVANYTLVDETPEDSDTTYVESSGDQIDTYEFADLSVSGTPLAAMLAVKARHTTGSPSLKLICRIDGDNYESDDSFPTSSTYNSDYHANCWSVNPATNQPWTVETFNAAQWGVRCLAAGIRVSQVGLMVYVKAAESDQCLASGASRDYCGSVNEDVN